MWQWGCCTTSGVLLNNTSHQWINHLHASVAGVSGGLETSRVRACLLVCACSCTLLSTCTYMVADNCSLFQFMQKTTAPQQIYATKGVLCGGEKKPCLPVHRHLLLRALAQRLPGAVLCEGDPGWWRQGGKHISTHSAASSVFVPLCTTGCQELAMQHLTGKKTKITVYV